MGREKLESAIETLKGQYFSLSWVYQDVTANHKQEKILHWPGPPEDDILIVVHQSQGELPCSWSTHLCGIAARTAQAGTFTSPAAQTSPPQQVYFIASFLRTG